MLNQKEPIFIAGAWPYANGSLHLGHIAGLLAGDVLARYYRAASHPVMFVSGSDAHGTPVALTAEKEGKTPEEVATQYHEEFKQTFLDLAFTYDSYFFTHHPDHFTVVQEMFLKLLEKDLIYKQTQEQPYSVKAERFLPDRYVEGTCPHCGFGSARGDQCDNCGKLLDPRELINPVSKLDGEPPEWRETEHFFLRLSAFQNELREWVANSSNWKVNAKKFTLGQLEGELPDRAITRDIEWGVPVPLEGFETKRIYVWFEAVIGYLSASKQLGETWKEFWQNPAAYHYYVHGKDNITFHTIIWPSMLMGHSGLELPDAIVSSEYLNLENQQFSKSRGWGVWMPDMLSRFDADQIRFWILLAGPETGDANFTWEDFQKVINKDFVGVAANLVHRVSSFIHKHFPEGVQRGALNEASIALLADCDREFDEIAELIKSHDLRKALDRILRLADRGNQYLEQEAPWKAVKEDKSKAETALWTAANFGLNLATMLYPFVPGFAQKVYANLGLEPEFTWETRSLEKIKFSSEPTPPANMITDELIEEAKGK